MTMTITTRVSLRRARMPTSLVGIQIGQIVDDEFPTIPSRMTTVGSTSLRHFDPRVEFPSRPFPVSLPLIRRPCSRPAPASSSPIPTATTALTTTTTTASFRIRPTPARKTRSSSPPRSLGPAPETEPASPPSPRPRPRNAARPPTRVWPTVPNTVARATIPSRRFRDRFPRSLPRETRSRLGEEWMCRNNLCVFRTQCTIRTSNKFQI
mmetsp:Transcript_3807/g.8124  ORF Transcript_3807/g.8124 Transcript_3807/m.8124 type:complete len:209 (+) Transcript_3807:1215-1841(+)